MSASRRPPPSSTVNPPFIFGASQSPQLKATEKSHTGPSIQVIPQPSKLAFGTSNSASEFFQKPQNPSSSFSYNFTNPKPTPPDMASHEDVENLFEVFKNTSITNVDQEELQRHISLLGKSKELYAAKLDNNARLEEVRNAPLFTRAVRAAIKNQEVDIGQRGLASFDAFPQYGLIGSRAPSNYDTDRGAGSIEPDHDIIYANMNAPWSAFICGSQGAGKSHTFACLLENALLSNNAGGMLPDPMSGIIFHYDKFTSHSSTQICEAAYLCSSGIPVRVLVSPTNFYTMQKLYSDLPGIPKNAPRPQVVPLMFHENQLNVGNMKTLMSVSDESGHPPLYLAMLDKHLRDMAKERKGRPGFDYASFKERLHSSGFTPLQLGPLEIRLQLLEEFLDLSPSNADRKNLWGFGKGTLTIIDLSCPFVTENDACALFSICLSLFLEQRSMGARIIALDEAHKFLTKSGEAENFTQQLISIIRQQRHLASRVVIATQEPTLSPSLLELCNVTFVHRFRSPRWMDALKGHLAGASNLKKTGQGSLEELEKTIYALRTGEALLFSPDSLLDITKSTSDSGYPQITVSALLDRFVKIRIRDRITADGGKSIMASDRAASVTWTPSSEDQSEIGESENESESTNSTTSEELVTASKPAKPAAAAAPPPPPSRFQPPRAMKKPKSVLSHAHPQPPSSTATASTAAQPKPPTKTPMILDLEHALRLTTIKMMKAHPSSIDFGDVRRAVETQFHLRAGHLNTEDWKGRSKKVIKTAVKKQVKATGSPPPKNATWMF